MTDIRIVEIVNLQTMSMDWLLLNTGALDETEELATAVTVALGTDALADVDDELPDPDSSDRRGWWGDYQADVIWNGWPIGCKNWLLSRVGINPIDFKHGSTVERARQYTQMALQPFVDQAICSGVTVTAWRAGLDRIYTKVIMYRGPKQDIALQFQIVWTEMIGER
jgi:phage gp46-like protein